MQTSRFEVKEVDIEENDEVEKELEKEDVMPTLIPFFVSLQTNTQLYHWNVNVYNKHVISDELYNSLLKSIDAFVEVLQGELNGVKLSFKKDSVILEQKNSVEFLEYLNDCIEKLNSLKNLFKDETTYLVNILDDMITSINRAVYKLKLE